MRLKWTYYIRGVSQIVRSVALPCSGLGWAGVVCGLRPGCYNEGMCSVMRLCARLSAQGVRWFLMIESVPQQRTQAANIALSCKINMAKINNKTGIWSGHFST